jgi:hypothetical protein
MAATLGDTLSTFVPSTSRSRLINSVARYLWSMCNSPNNELEQTRGK